LNSIENAETHKTPDSPPRADEKIPSDPHIQPTETTAVFPLPRPENRLPVMLTIHSEQDIDTPQQDNMELLTEGTMNFTPDGLTLTYQESALTGMEGTTTVVERSGSRVVLRRMGTVSSQMVFEQGRQHTSLYETPYGELSIDIQTGYLRNTVTENGGLLEIRYSISVEHASAGKNRFRMKVRRMRGAAV